MRYIPSILLLFAVILTTHAQQFNISCSYAGTSHGSGLNSPSAKAVQVVQEICVALNISSIPIYSSQVPNAGATIVNSSPIIVYNPGFLADMFNQNAWAPISVLAHEVGHHMNLDASWYGSFQHPWTKELKADYISGYALGTIGASKDEAISAQRIMFSYIGSTSHPDSPKRISAIIAGWEKSQGRSVKSFVPCNHALHVNGDSSPCIHPQHQADNGPCAHTCINSFGYPFACHSMGDVVNCSHPMHYADYSPCIHAAHPAGH